MGVLLIGASTVAAQPDGMTGAGVIQDPLEQIPIAIRVDSGPRSADEILSARLVPGAPAPASDRPVKVFETEVAAAGAPWLRLLFDEVVLSGDPGLGNDAFLWITSAADGAVQVMTQDDLEKWGHTSAYFNGDRVTVEVYAYPNTGPVSLSMSTALIGVAADATPESLCGTDNRVASTDPRSGRVLPAQCTAFMINDQTHNFLTAGHCAFGLSVVQFNVPPSTPTGVIVNPPPEDQYPVDQASVQFQFEGLGIDWAYFGCFENSNTGLTPFQAQGSFYVLGNTAPPVLNQTIRITGYGTDTTPNTANQTLQTDTGPYTSLSGDVIRYQVDTTGGNSGSAVIDLNTGLCIGIHTNAGCNAVGTGSNQGTNIKQTNLRNAISNPKGIAAAADCNNNGVPDSIDIAQGAADCNNNGVPDTCEAITTPADLNGDGFVDGADISVILNLFGSEGGAADLNQDGFVNGPDISIVLNLWGLPCGG